MGASVNKQIKIIDIFDHLIESGHITREQLQIAISEDKSNQKGIENNLVFLGFISEQALAQSIADFSGIEHMSLYRIILDQELVRKIPKEQANHYKIIPIDITKDGVLKLGMVDVHDLPAIDYARFTISGTTRIDPVSISLSDFMEAFDRYYGYEMSIHNLLHEIESKGDKSSDDSYVNPTVRLVDAIIIDAVKSRASDIHFEPEGAFMRIRYRVDGIMRQISTLHSSYWPSMCIRIKIISGMNIAESRKPQNGRMTFRIGHNEVDIRAASHPTVHGENIVLRILDKSRGILSIDDLGYGIDLKSRLLNSLTKPEGILIITGPTGSGKTTSLYSILEEISSVDLNIMTLEEPVEYAIPMVRQTAISDQIDFANGVKSILRQDPDVILIGEIRDKDTAQMAMRASMTGHKVFSTLHTNSAVDAISRLQDLGVHHHTIADNVIGIMAQRLVRILCPLCKVKHKPTDEECTLLGARDKTIYQALGCEECSKTGYKGREAIAELVIIDNKLKSMIADGAGREAICEYLNQTQHKSLRASAITKVTSGVTSISEVKRVIDLRYDGS